MADIAAALPRPSISRKLLMAGLLLAAGVGYLVYSSLSATTVYYMTVPELREQGMSSDRMARVSGNVVPGSALREGTLLRFAITDESGSPPLSVVYDGVVPDIFQDGIQVVVEGSLNQEGVFAATTLLAKCPSRFQTVERGAGLTGAN